MKTLNEQLEIIKRGTVEIISDDELRKKIEKSIKDRKPLVVKAGFDPTAPDIHLGHTVLLRKMRHFQECGHKVVFLIGDATAMVGDPTGQSQTRKILTWDQINKNAESYQEQVGKILNTKDPALFERRHNRSWFSVPNFFDKFTELAQRYTIARLLERDDFEKRLNENKPISFLEVFYPLMQGYDSVELRSDIELGGTDQKFNMLVGRNLQQAYGQEPQVVLSMPILEGLDGVNKMSKSLNNYVGINDAPNDMFGKIMSISDDIMLKYYELLTDEPLEDIKKKLKDGSLHPKKAKQMLAKLIVSQYNGTQAGEDAIKYFDDVFAQKQVPDDIQEITVACEKDTILNLLRSARIIESASEIKRLLSQGAVTVDGSKIIELDREIVISDGGIVIKVGKRKFVKLTKKK